ncbi:hypothetical protein ACFE04_030634 [Oxalis oulophora]
MRNNRVIPMITPSHDLHYDDDDNHLQLVDYWHDNYPRGSSYRSNCDYLHARRAFLSSYHLSEQNDQRNNFRGLVKKTVREIDKAIRGVLMGIRNKISKRRVGVRAFRISLSLPSSSFVSFRCFTPWFSKNALMNGEAMEYFDDNY